MRKGLEDFLGFWKDGKNFTSVFVWKAFDFALFIEFISHVISKFPTENVSYSGDHGKVLALVRDMSTDPGPQNNFWVAFLNFI